MNRSTDHRLSTPQRYGLAHWEVRLPNHKIADKGDRTLFAAVPGSPGCNLVCAMQADGRRGKEVEHTEERSGGQGNSRWWRDAGVKKMEGRNLAHGMQVPFEGLSAVPFQQPRGPECETRQCPK